MHFCTGGRLFQFSLKQEVAAVVTSSLFHLATCHESLRLKHKDCQGDRLHHQQGDTHTHKINKKKMLPEPSGTHAHIHQYTTPITSILSYNVTLKGWVWPTCTCSSPCADALKRRRQTGPQGATSSYYWLSQTGLGLKKNKAQSSPLSHFPLLLDTYLLFLHRHTHTHIYADAERQ